MDYSKLKELLDLTKTDQENINLLNDSNVIINTVLSTRDVKEFLILSMKWLAIKDGTGTPERMTMEALQNFDSFDFKKPGVLTVFMTILGALKSVNLLSQAEHDHLASLTTTKTSIAEQQLGRKVNLTDIENGRNYNG